LMSGRILLLLPLISLVEPLVTGILSLAEVKWLNIETLRFLVGKFFLVVGGTIFPIAEVREPYRSWLLKLPFSDVVFQPAWFAVTGEFYQVSAIKWLMNLIVFFVILFSVNILFYRYVKTSYAAYGG
jgi:hypothetical protein